MPSTGVVVWVTGLSAAGKSTFAAEFCKNLQEAGTLPVLLDGDALRSMLGLTSAKYTRDERLKLAFKYAHICQYLANQGHIVVIATIALFQEIHKWNRTNLPNYREVFMDYPISELQVRDPKGLYARHRLGEVSSVAGLDFPVDFPSNPHWHVTSNQEEYPRIVQELIIEVLGLHHAQ